MSTISRREARRAAVFMLFQWDVTGRPLGSLYEGEVDSYTLQLADAVTEHAAELDDRITSASDDWTADRLGAVERNVLRVALEELDEGEVPVEVVLDEAVTLAKRYASEDAARLVNGILGKLVREEQSEVSTDESLSRAEELLTRVEAARAELELVSAGDGGSPERAIELLGELSELAKAVEEELTRAQRAAEEDAQP